MLKIISVAEITPCNKEVKELNGLIITKLSAVYYQKEINTRFILASLLLLKDIK